MELIAAIFDFFINFIIDDTINEITDENKKGKRDKRYIFFTILIFISAIANFVFLYIFFKRNNIIVGLIFTLLEMLTFLIWIIVAVGKKKIKKDKVR